MVQNKLTPAAERLLKLAVGKSTTMSAAPAGVLKTIKRRHPDWRFTTTHVDGGYVVRRVA